MSSDIKPVDTKFNEREAHDRLWATLEAMAKGAGLSASGLAKRAGLDPTCFNLSKRTNTEGRPRWPSTESLFRAMQAIDKSFLEFAQEMERAPAVVSAPSVNVPLIRLDDLRKFPIATFGEKVTGRSENWDRFTATLSDAAFAIEIEGDDFDQIYPEGTVVIVMPTTDVRRGDRVFCMIANDANGSGALHFGKVTRVVGSRCDIVQSNGQTVSTDLANPVLRAVWASQ